MKTRQATLSYAARLTRLSVLALLWTSAAFAQQNVFWRDSSGTDIWENFTNEPWYYQTWASTEPRPDYFPVPTRNYVFFDNNYNTTSWLNNSWFSVNTLTVQNYSRTFNYTGAAGISATVGFYNDVGTSQTFNVPIGVDGSTVQFRSNASGGSMAFTSDFFLNSNTAEFGGDSGNTTITVSGTVSGSGGAVSKVNANTLVLTQNNSYSGGTTISGGTLRIGNDGALGSGQFRMTGSSAITSNDTSTRNISNVLGTFAGSSATYTFGSSNGSFNGDLNFNNTTASALSTTSASRTFAVYNTTTFANAFTSAGSSLTKTQAGTLTLLGNSSFGGGVTLNDGVIRVGHANALGTGALTIGSGSTKTLASDSATARTIANDVNMDNDLTLGQSSVGTGSLDFSGTFDVGTVGSTRLLNLVGDHTISGAMTGSIGLAKQGTGRLTLSGTSSHTGGLYIDNQTLEISGGSISAATIDIGGGVFAQNSNNATLEISAPLTIASDVYVKNAYSGAGDRTLVLSNGSGTATLSGDVSLEKTLTVQTATSGALTGAISNSGGLTKTGAGTLTLSGANTFTGTTTVSAGTLTLNGGSHTSNEYQINGGSFSQTASTAWSTDIFHVQGYNSGIGITLADLADSVDNDSELRFTVTAAGDGINPIEFTSTNPFTQAYGGSAAAWAAEWSLRLDTDDSIGSGGFQPLSLLSSTGGYNLQILNGLLTIHARDSEGAPTTFTGVGHGDSISLLSGSELATYQVSFSSTGVDLVFMGSRAIPEPGTLSLIGLALLALRRRLRAGVEKGA